MHSAYSFVAKTAENKDRIRRLRLKNAELLQLREQLSTPPAIVSKKSLVEASNNEELRALCKPPKKLEDLEHIMAVRDKSGGEGRQGPEPRDRLQRRQAAIDKYFTAVSNKHFLSCLAKSIGAISEGTYAVKAANMTRAWQVIARLPVTGKLDALFGFLLYKFSKNLYGKSFKAAMPASHYLSALEQFNGDLVAVVDCLGIMSSELKESHANPELALSRGFAEALKGRISYLVTKLADHGHVVTDLESPFYTKASLAADLLAVFKSQLADALVALHNLLFAQVVHGRGFAAVFKAELAGDLEEGSTEATRKTFALIGVFGKARRFFLRSLASEEAREQLEAHVEESLKVFEERSARHHKLSALLDKDTSKAIRARLLANN